MTNDPYDRGLGIFRDSEADDDVHTRTEVLSADPTDAGAGTAQYPAQGAGQMGLDDSVPTPVTSDQVSDTAAFGNDTGFTGNSYDTPAGTTGATPYSSTAGPTGGGDIAGSAVDKATDVAGSAADKAAELKDVALERGGDVAAVAKDELARLANEARTEVQSLWSNASEQLRGQAAAGQQQLSELLHSLAGELGEMASKSDNTGPLTALARQAAAKGGELSHWLAGSEPGDVLVEVRRFARRRPFVFLASAALAGVVVGRLGRGLMAAGDNDNVHPARAAVTDTGSTPAATGATSADAYGQDAGSAR